MRVAIAGAGGFLGSALTRALVADGVAVARLVRRATRSADEIAWDPVAATLDHDALADFAPDAVVHLGGSPVMTRWTRRAMRRIRNSRVGSTRVLVDALAALPRPPRRFLCASAVGWYGSRPDPVDESAPPDPGFLGETCRLWEAEAFRAAGFGARVATLRLGVVLDPAGGMLGRLLPLFRLGLGARLAGGRHHVSWIALCDAVAAIRFLLSRDLQGPVDLTTDDFPTQAEWTRAVARRLRRPAPWSIPRPVLAAAFGRPALEFLLQDVRARPAVLTAAGFRWEHPTLAGFLAAALPR